MHSTKQLNALGLLACVMLLACTPAPKKYSATPMPIDNDNYYSQPGSYIPSGIPSSGQYGGCNQINDAPSCGGG